MLSMLYSSCFENMPVKKIFRVFFTSVGVSFQNTYTFWESGGMFWGPKNIFFKNTAVQLPFLDTCPTHFESVFIFVWLGYCLQ